MLDLWVLKVMGDGILLTDDILYKKWTQFAGVPNNHLDLSVMNRLDPIEELYDMYSEEEDTLRIVELGDNGLDLVLDIEEPANPYMDL